MATTPILDSLGDNEKSALQSLKDRQVAVGLSAGTLASGAAVQLERMDKQEFHLLQNSGILEYTSGNDFAKITARGVQGIDEL